MSTEYDCYFFTQHCLGKLAIAYKNLTFRDFQLKKHPIPAGRFANVGARYAHWYQLKPKTISDRRFANP
ncbi:hypothetical protein [uncultured Nostoc sp.]|uniref:hypothetical protein n=1 Tax=uncultured Nostoc sp. TaxID=340711 RepID=UPI0035C9DF7D